jgi:hypothetical protein
VSTLGVLFAIGGIDHGFFETLQGNKPTPGLFIRSIGPQQQMWPYGTEDAFTLIPNFLFSGIVSITLACSSRSGRSASSNANTEAQSFFCSSSCSFSPAGA